MTGEGKPLVLLHGFGLSGMDWEGAGYAEPLRASGHRLVVIDLRGHGASSKPHDPEAYLPAAEATDIIAVLDSLAIERADFVGYSLGGRLALEVATMFPGRIRKLVVGGTHPYAQDMRLYRVAVSRGIEGWIEVIEKIGGPLPAPARQRIALGDVNALRAAVALDRPDISMKLTDNARPYLLGRSILGFHTHFHCNNFVETVDRFVESRIDREHRSVAHHGNETLSRMHLTRILAKPHILVLGPARGND